MNFTRRNSAQSHSPGRRPILWVAVLTLVVGCVMLYSFLIGRSIIKRYAPLVDATMEIKLEAALAHLWFEEIISGDRSITIEEVWEHLDQAEWYALAMLEGGENLEGNFVPLEDIGLHLEIQKTLAGIRTFRAIGRERWRARSQSGIGTDIDRRFDKTFEEFLASADGVETALQRVIESQLQRFSVLQSLLIAIVVALGAVMGVVLQRHERRRTDDMLTLQDKEENLRTTLNSIGDGVIATDTDGCITRMNPVAEKLTGWALEEAQGKPLTKVFNIVNAHTKEPADNPAKRVIDSGMIVGLANHTMLIARDGTEYQIADSAAPITDADAVVVGVVLVFRDVTEENATAEALHRNEEAYRNLFNHMLGGFAVHEIILDDDDKPLDYRFLSVNPALETLTGLKAEAITGKTVHEVLPNTDLPWFEAYEKVALTGEPVRFENFSTELGKHLEVFAYVPEPGKFACVFQDITERKLLEEQLHQSEKMQAIGQLAGGIAHDFNNQLAGILGYADMLVPALEDEKLRGYANAIVRASKRSADLTQQLLAFARKGKNLSTPVNLHSVISEVAALLEHSIDKRIMIQQILKASPCMAAGDPTQLQNALLNIAINARDAMPDGGKIIFETDSVMLDEAYCAMHPYDITPGRYVQVCVTDSGVGMDEETQKRIFEPFFTTKGQERGVGMGLAAVYGTIKNHHGAINVYSEVGHGTSFKVYLPVVESSDDEAEEASRSSPVKGTARILLVEDEDMVRNMVSTMLENLGYKVVICDDGVEALEYYRTAWQQVDLVILDMIMPRMGGRETFIAMRAINPDIRALLSSGYALNGEAQSILDEGVIGFLQKPYQVAALSEKIADVLGVARPGGKALE